MTRLILPFSPVGTELRLESSLCEAESGNSRQNRYPKISMRNSLAPSEGIKVVKNTVMVRRNQ